MINLIPNEEKKRMTANFYYRVAIVFLVMIDFCILIAFVSIIPSYILASIKNTVVNTKLKTQRTEPIPLFDQQALTAINDINSKLDMIENAEKNKFLISEKVINNISSVKRPDIKITRILYENDSIAGRKISIEGIAPSREVLLIFRQALEDNSAFKNVDLPISNFIKGSNIRFSLSLIPA